MPDRSHPTDLDDDGKPFDEDAYFAKMGFTKAERKGPDKYQLLRDRFRSGHIAHDGQSILETRSANEWMQQTDEPAERVHKLFGDFWLEGELCILFADTAKGKSILAVQIAESIARGRLIKPFEMTAEPGKVLYLDFELSDRQFRQRYAGNTTSDGIRIRDRRFHKNFFRCQILQQDVPPAFRSLGDFLAHSIRNAIDEIEPSVLIIDNLSWLRTSNTNASAALELMRELKTLKETLGLSILVLAHTPKRPFARPLTVNDLAGSKQLSNFTDTMFAIGDSIQGSNIRYLKQVKPRSTPMIYDETNVAVARIEKPSNFLKFTFTGFAREAEHLIRAYHHIEHAGSAVSAAEADRLQALEFRKKLIANCRDLSKQGLSQRQIAAQLGLGATTVRRYLS
jgi:hypothetical protein